MAGVDIRVVVEDVAAQLALSYDRINLQRADTVGGSYANVVFMALVASTYYYTLNDPAGDVNKWYRYRFEDNSGTPASDFSDPFRVDAVSRLRVRQAAMSRYGAGIVIAAAAGSDVNTVVTNDGRMKSSIYRDTRHKGTWLYPTSGSGAGSASQIVSSTPGSGSFEVSPDLAGAVAAGNEVEVHYLAHPEVWNDAIARAALRYFYVDRVPVRAVAGQDEYSLAMLPWLHDEGQVHDVRYYPSRTSGGVDEGVDISWAGLGKWWGVRKDSEALTLTLSPPPDASQLLWLETTRPMPALYTDISTAPTVAAEELFAALAYDEVLDFLAETAASADKEYYKQKRRDKLPKLRRLLVKYRPKPKASPAQGANPPTVPQPFKAR